MGPKETLNTLQHLYERHKLVTYPRTDSNYLTDDMVDTIQERLRAILATDFKSHVRDLISKSFLLKCIFLIIKSFRSSCDYSHRS